MVGDGGVELWSEDTVRHWVVLVAGASEEDAAKVELDGRQLIEYDKGALREQLEAFGLGGASVEAVVMALDARRWAVTQVVRCWIVRVTITR